MSDVLYVSDRIRVPRAELVFSYSRSGGPGGQNVNKVSSKALLRWAVLATRSLPEDVKTRFLARYRSRLTNEGDLLITSQRTREQPRNMEDCLEKLREMLLAVATPPKPRKAVKPSKKMKARRLQAKKFRSEVKAGRRSPSDS